jgi:hypothetical protein
MDVVSTTMTTRTNPPHDVARARLNTLIAEMGKQAAVAHIARCVFGPGSEGLMTGVKPVEPRPTATEAMDAMCARVAARQATQTITVRKVA